MYQHQNNRTMTEKEKAEKLYNDILKPYREIITNLEQRNRELVEALTEFYNMQIGHLSAVKTTPAQRQEMARIALSKNSAPAGQKGG